jgi:16S rRNA (cytosine1402-N4)-methyltransferase
MTRAVVQHQPVLLQAAIGLLNIQPGEAYLDCTVGSAGHAVEIVKKGGKLYGLDVDPAAIQRAKKRLAGSFYRLEQMNFAQLSAAAEKFRLTSVAGILMDLGLSSEQLADKTRGFSFQHQAPLDMRANPSLSVTAADLINGLTKGELNELFKKLGQEQHSLSIADHIVRARRAKPINTTLELADIVCRAVPPKRGRLHPATKVFQALRIAVNDELNSLKTALPLAVDLLKENGRLVIISFHSLEDSIVKHFIKNQTNLKILTKKPIRPTAAEIAQNPRARSAKLRAAEKHD